MRHSRLSSTIVIATAMVLAALLVPKPTVAQTQPPAPQTQPPAQTATPGPYKPVAITLPTPLADPAFDAFRKELAEIAKKKDRAALARLIAATFFWVPEDSDIADPKKSAMENLAKALNIDGDDAVGWESLAAYAAEPTAMADPQRNGVFCAPAEPIFDEKAADELVEATQTDAYDWGYPVRDGIEVRSVAKEDAPVIDRLGLYLVRILTDDSTANGVVPAFVKVVMPSGKVGFVPAEAVLPVAGEQLCYVKEASGWKIAGFLGGEPNQ